MNVQQRPLLMLMTSFVHGGAERHTITLANNLGARIPIVLAYLKPPESLLPSVDTSAVKEVVNLRARKGLDKAAVQRLAELIDRCQPSMVMCVNAYPLLYAHLARRRAHCKPKIVDVFHTTLMRDWREQAEMLFYRPWFWRSDHLVFVCGNQRAHWFKRGLFARKNHVIYNGVDAEHFAPMSPHQVAVGRARYGIAATDRVVGISAVLRPEKAHELLLQAVARAREAGMHWKVLLIGDGVRRPEIDAEIARLGLGPQVAITGLLPDVREAIACCDVLSLVSVSETFSIAAIEAMAMGKPMIMSNIGGAAEQVTPGVEGELFPSRDVPALAACLARCWPQEVTEAMGQRARERVVRAFSQQAMLRDYAQLFEVPAPAKALERNA
jgi:glycosyltransferase involved in cell wall biosynthesis